MTEFRRKSFILIHRIFKDLNQTMKFELLFKVTLIFKELLEKIQRGDQQMIMLPLF